MIAEAPKPRKDLARIRVATPTQSKAVDKILDPRVMGFILPTRVQSWRKLAAYDRSDPGVAKIMISRVLGLHRNLRETVLASNLPIRYARSGNQPSLDLGGDSEFYKRFKKPSARSTHGPTRGNCWFRFYNASFRKKGSGHS